MWTAKLPRRPILSDFTGLAITERCSACLSLLNCKQKERSISSGIFLSWEFVTGIQGWQAGSVLGGIESPGVGCQSVSWNQLPLCFLFNALLKQLYLGVCVTKDRLGICPRITQVIPEASCLAKIKKRWYNYVFSFLLLPVWSCWH